MLLKLVSMLLHYVCRVVLIQIAKGSVAVAIKVQGSLRQFGVQVEHAVCEADDVGVHLNPRAEEEIGRRKLVVAVVRVLDRVLIKKF